MKDKVLLILLTLLICKPVESLLTTCQGLSVPQCGIRGHFVLASQNEPCEGTVNQTYMYTFKKLPKFKKEKKIVEFLIRVYFYKNTGLG